MNDDSIETVRGSGNVFRDFLYPDADVRQAKALMGTQIMHILDWEGLSTRQAEARTGVSHSEVQPLHHRPADGHSCVAWSGGGVVRLCASAR